MKNTKIVLYLFSTFFQSTSLFSSIFPYLFPSLFHSLFSSFFRNLPFFPLLFNFSLLLYSLLLAISAITFAFLHILFLHILQQIFKFCICVCNLPSAFSPQLILISHLIHLLLVLSASLYLYLTGGRFNVLQSMLS